MQSVDVLLRSNQDSGDFLSAQKSILGTKLTVLKNRLAERFELSEKTLSALLTDELAVGGRLENLHSNKTLGFNAEIDFLERRLFEIQNSTKRERIDCWRDVGWTLKELMDVWEAYLTAKRREEFLGGNRGGKG